MSLSESLLGDANESPSSPVSTPVPSYNPPVDSLVEKLSASLDGLFVIRNVRRIQQQIRTQTVNAVVFEGNLVEDAEKVYPVVSERFHAMGFTLMMERRNGVDWLVALEGLIQERKFSSPIWLHALLLVITILTTTISGAYMWGYTPANLIRDLSARRLNSLFTGLSHGLPFALTLLLILGVHEMGHYIAARRHRVSVTLPYFIPFPFIGILGTLGAVIFIKSPLNNRKSLFDVGISGPLAGFVVALIAFIIGMSQTSGNTNRLFMDTFGNERIGMPILLQVIGKAARPSMTLTLATHVSRQPIALAAWFGMLLTVLNLIPVGQLDGGHVMYTLFGRAAWAIAAVIFALMILAGLTIFPSLLFFSFLVFLTGLRHPPPGNDITPLNWTRKLIGFGTIVLFFLIATPVPFTITAFR